MSIISRTGSVAGSILAIVIIWILPQTATAISALFRGIIMSAIDVDSLEDWTIILAKAALTLVLVVLLFAIDRRSKGLV